MIRYLYAIAQDLARVDDLSGARGERLTLLSIEGVVVVAGEIEAAPTVDEAALTRQDQVVRQLHARAAALLPLRFGAAFGAEAELQRAVTLRLPGLRDRLDQVRNADQMTLRVLAAPGAPGAHGAAGALGASDALAASGAEYLRARAARSVPPGIVPLLDALKPIARATRVEAGRVPGVVATVYQLIDRGTSAEYAATVEAAAGALPNLTVRLSGPAPCYAFT